MAKNASVVGVELQRFEDKLKEFQDYLEKNTIITKVHNGKLKEADEANRYKEIDMQIKMQNAVLTWLPILEKLRTTEDSRKFEARGGQEVNGLMEQA